MYLWDQHTIKNITCTTCPGHVLLIHSKGSIWPFQVKSRRNPPRSLCFLDSTASPAPEQWSPGSAASTERQPRPQTTLPGAHRSLKLSAGEEPGCQLTYNEQQGKKLIQPTRQREVTITHVTSGSQRQGRASPAHLARGLESAFPEGRRAGLQGFTEHGFSGRNPELPAASSLGGNTVLVLGLRLPVIWSEKEGTGLHPESAPIRGFPLAND